MVAEIKAAVVLAVALVLIVFKLRGWAATGSVALLTSAGMRCSTPQASWRLIYPQPLTAVTLGSWIVLGGLGISGLIAAMQTWVVPRTGSTVIAAHYCGRVAPAAGP